MPIPISKIPLRQRGTCNLNKGATLLVNNGISIVVRDYDNPRNTEYKEKTRQRQEKVNYWLNNKKDA